MTTDVLETVSPAELAWHAGRDADAERFLLDALLAAGPSHERLAWASIDLARFALALDAPFAARAIALPFAHGVGELHALWASMICGAFSCGERPAFEDAKRAVEGFASSRPELASAVAVDSARLSLSCGAPHESAEWIDLASRIPGGPCTRLAVFRLRAELAHASGGFDAASGPLLEAMSLAKEHGWARELARAELAHGLNQAAIGTDVDPPITSIRRAAPVLSACGSWRDRTRLRQALRSHGNRTSDRSMSDEATAALERLDQAAGAAHAGALTQAVERLRDSGAIAADPSGLLEQTLGWLRHVRLLAGEMSSSQALLADLLGEALSQRDRSAAMLSGLQSLDDLADVHLYAMTAAQIAADLFGAERVVVAERQGDVLVALGVHPQAVSDWPWRTLAEQAIVAPAAEPNELVGRAPVRSKSAGSSMALRLEAQPFRGALVLDKGASSQRFREDDLVLASLLCAQVSHGLARLRAREAEGVALRRLAATLDAIRDGVIAIDGDGFVRSINPVALRLLRAEDAGLLNCRLPDQPHLQPLWELLSKSPRADGVIVRLTHGTLVVTSRPAEAEGGLVATLVELGRVRNLAVRITAARPRYTFEDIAGSSPHMREVIATGRLAASVESTLLITGESGTGKELVAQAVHTGGARMEHPFVGINCAAMPRDLLEAELFGYEKGAFTGARQDGLVGKFEQAGEGTILLDEIGDMPLDMQAKLLRVLQERVVVRLGGSRERKVRCRVIATTNRNLEEEVARGTFRLDLLFRLRVLHIHIKALRARPDDIAALAAHFLRRTARALGSAATDVGAAAIGSLQEHWWPGNARELANVIERELAFLPREAKCLEHLRQPVAQGWPEAEAPTSPHARRHILGGPLPPPSSGTMPSGLLKSMAEIEKTAYLEALESCGGRVVDAARLLGVSKTQFYAKLKAWKTG